MNERTDSGSRRSCSAVEPARSANRIVTILRASDCGVGTAAWPALMIGGAACLGGPPIGVPHSLQKREPGGGVTPQPGHAIASLAPQSLQKADPAGGSWPHCAHVMA